ncbi:protein VACUOLELESS GAMETOPHYTES-like [Bidens hawaiensis]|uniref:protein VACUOLELESS GAMETOPHYTES-like n=1 Tax=Bidens hawaiensis TaxID=980011 RepID=UPI00404A6B4B
MGKLTHNTQIKHSSHPHLLQLSSNLQLQTNISCAGCNLLVSSSDHIYACRPCNFFLHASCSKFPELITHPSHREHTLSLLPNSIYPGGFFRCDACSQQGTRFSYHCQVCDFDLHVLCATKPLSVNHPFHPHQLVLTFSSPYGQKSGFSCDVCQSVGSADQWLYRCVSCEFDVHLHCATAKPALQHSHSYPGPGSVSHQPQPLTHSMSTGHGHGQTYHYQPQAPVNYQGNGYQAPPPPQTQAPVGYQSYPVPTQQPPIPVGGQNYQMQQQPQPNQNVGPGNGLADAVVNGFVEGVMHQIGQDFVQSLTGGGGGGGGGDVVNVDYECSTTNDHECSYE